MYSFKITSKHYKQEKNSGAKLKSAGRKTNQTRGWPDNEAGWVNLQSNLRYPHPESFIGIERWNKNIQMNSPYFLYRYS